MTYKLALKLKEAGFPQRLTSGSRVIDKDSETYHVGEVHISEYGSDGNQSLYDRGCGCCSGEVYEWVKVPSLSELISACGDGLWSLTKHGNVWQTNWRDGIPGETAHTDLDVAVANLWLALNAKD